MISDCNEDGDKDRLEINFRNKDKLEIKINFRDKDKLEINFLFKFIPFKYVFSKICRWWKWRCLVSGYLLQLFNFSSSNQWPLITNFFNASCVLSIYVLTSDSYNNSWLSWRVTFKVAIASNESLSKVMWPRILLPQGQQIGALFLAPVFHSMQPIKRQVTVGNHHYKALQALPWPFHLVTLGQSAVVTCSL